MELHLRVPADRWCVTFNELFHFVEDVRAAWLAGEILQSDSWHVFVWDRKGMIWLVVAQAYPTDHKGVFCPP